MFWFPELFGMIRLFQVLLISSCIACLWLGFMVVHEFGHVLAAWASGGAVAVVVLHPLQISWSAFKTNPHLLVVAWGGPGLGSLLPLTFLAAGRLLRCPGAYLFQFFAGFCLIANGFYLIIDSFGGGGDGATLLKDGAAQWQLLLFGAVATPLGFWLWHGIGPHFGLGIARGRVNRVAALTCAGLLLLIVSVEVLFYPL
jgi:hypothetical protein